MSDLAPPILYASYYPVPGVGSGGKHRNLQLLDLCRRAGGAPRAVDAATGSRREDWADVLRGASIALAHFPTAAFPPRGLRRAGALRRGFRHAAGLYPGARVFLLESTPDSALTVYAKRGGLRVLAFPQNLEHFFWGRLATNGFCERLTLEREMEGLGLADHVYTISREEQWLAQFYQVPARFLPYHPPPEIAGQLLAVRQRRLDGTVGGDGLLLLLGSGDYPPTFAGMAQVVRWLGAESPSLRKRVLVIGQGTEKLQAICAEHGVACQGTVSFPQLEAFLAQASAIITHQNAGGGALTRIPEMLMSGIPVIANAISARSYFNSPGVYVYDHREELLSYLKRDLPVPPVPSAPAQTEQEIIELLRG